jgi:hypothetical protein
LYSAGSLDGDGVKQEKTKQVSETAGRKQKQCEESARHGRGCELAERASPGEGAVSDMTKEVEKYHQLPARHGR